VIVARKTARQPTLAARRARKPTSLMERAKKKDAALVAVARKTARLAARLVARLLEVKNAGEAEEIRKAPRATSYPNLRAVATFQSLIDRVGVETMDEVEKEKAREHLALRLTVAKERGKEHLRLRVPAEREKERAAEGNCCVITRSLFEERGFRLRQVNPEALDLLLSYLNVLS
jgi:hypothetical protein